MNHLFLSSDGDLYDTNVTDWSSKPPLRRNYSRHHSLIQSIADFKATVRAGQFIWPGGYPAFFVCGDGESLCFKCANDEAKQVMQAIIARPLSSDWLVIACDVNYEESEMKCVNCGHPIDSAYGS